MQIAWLFFCTGTHVTNVKNQYREERLYDCDMKFMDKYTYKFMFH